jgi:hypothetical protein
VAEEFPRGLERLGEFVKSWAGRSAAAD